MPDGYGAAMRAPVRIGLQIPSFNFPGVAPVELCSRLVEIAATAEASGFDSLFVMDHLHQIPGVGPPENWMLEGNTILAALAARTERLQPRPDGRRRHVPQPGAAREDHDDARRHLRRPRDPSRSARAWFEDEHRAYGYDFPPLKERFERLEDALRIARAMFTQEAADLRRAALPRRGAYNNPRPLRGDIPILVGGSGERKTLRLVAQYADGVQHLRRPRADPAPDGRARRALRRRRPRSRARSRARASARSRSPRRTRRPSAGSPRGPTARNVDPERLRNVLTLGDAGRGRRAGAGAAPTPGVEGLIFHMPNPHDLDSVALAGETLVRALGGATRST